MRAYVAPALAAVTALSACDPGAIGQPSLQGSQFRVLHTILGGPPLTLVVDDRAVGSLIGFGDLSRTAVLSPGQHDLALVPGDTTHYLLALLTTTDGVDYTAFAIDSTAGDTVIVEPFVVTDTGATPTPGHGRLRIANLAAHAGAIDVYRTQPGIPGLIPAQRPLAFRAVTPYLESTPGKWTLLVSHAGMTDTLLVTDSIAVGAGHAATVALVDSSGARVTWRVLADL